MKATINIDFVLRFSPADGNLKGLKFEVLEQTEAVHPFNGELVTRTTLDVNGTPTEFFGMETTIYDDSHFYYDFSEKNPFKKAFMFESMAELRDEIVSESANVRRSTAREFRMKVGLFTSSWGQLIVADENGRLEEFGFASAIDFGGKHPTKKEIKTLYEEVVKSGATKFEIVYDACVRCWDSYADKFDGIDAEPTGEYVSVVLLSQ
jgi:hypothetical protein